jgi:hypothetical protein
MSGDSRFFAQFGGSGGGGGGITALEVGVTPIASGNVGRLLFEGTGNVLQESANLFWDITNSRLGIRTLQPDCTLDVVSVGTSNVRGIQGTHYDNTNAFSPSKIIGRRARGTEASPSAVQSGDALASFNGRGRKASAWSDTVGGYYVSANENWTNTATGTFLSFRGVNNGGTTVSEWMRIVGGNVGIGTDNPTFLFNVKGVNQSASTTSLAVQDSTNGTIFAVRNSSSLDFTNWGDSTVNSSKRIGLDNAQFGTQLLVESFGVSANTTGLATINVGIVSSFSPSSGISRYTNLSITPTINQTGTATGITRGIYVDPTLTAASSFRAIETTNDSGYSFYGAGTAPMYINGRIGVGRITAGASVDIQAAGALSTDVAFRVRNSADTADILAVQGNNQIVKGATAVIVPNVQAVVTAATVTPVSGNDIVTITAQSTALTLANPTGTWSQGQDFIIRIKDDGSAKAITWDTNYRAIGIGLPTTTIAGKTTYVGLIYNSTDSKWDAIGVTTEV